MYEHIGPSLSGFPPNSHVQSIVHVLLFVTQKEGNMSSNFHVGIREYRGKKGFMEMISSPEEATHKILRSLNQLLSTPKFLTASTKSNNELALNSSISCSFSGRKGTIVLQLDLDDSHPTGSIRYISSKLGRL